MQRRGEGLIRREEVEVNYDEKEMVGKKEVNGGEEGKEGERREKTH